MASVQQLMVGIEAVQKLVGSKEEELNRLKNELATRIGLLQRAIARGESTGDPLRDKVISVYGLSDLITEQHRLLQDKLAGKKGEFVLVRYPSEVRERFGGTLRSADFRQEIRFRIGVLQAETLQLAANGHSLALPVGKYLPGVWGAGFMDICAEEKPVVGELFEWLSPEDQPPSLAEYMVDVQLGRDLLIGDEAVRTACKESRDEKFFNVAAERLGRLILQPTEG